MPTILDNPYNPAARIRREAEREHNRKMRAMARAVLREAARACGCELRTGPARPAKDAEGKSLPPGSASYVALRESAALRDLNTPAFDVQENSLYLQQEAKKRAKGRN